MSSLTGETRISASSANLHPFLLIIEISILVCLGYNVFYFDLKFPNGAVGQILDILDYASNNILMPIVGLLTCILIGWIAKPKGRSNLYVRPA